MGNALRLRHGRLQQFDRVEVLDSTTNSPGGVE